LGIEIPRAAEPPFKAVFVVANQVVDDHGRPWCPGRGSNPYTRRARDFKSLVSTNFTTRALRELYRQARYEKGKAHCAFPFQTGAAEESRTLDLYLGKVSLYQLSYCRIFLEARAGVEPTYTDLQTSLNACVPWNSAHSMGSDGMRQYSPDRYTEDFLGINAFNVTNIRFHPIPSVFTAANLPQKRAEFSALCAVVNRFRPARFLQLVGFKRDVKLGLVGAGEEPQEISVWMRSKRAHGSLKAFLLGGYRQLRQTGAAARAAGKNKVLAGVVTVGNQAANIAKPQAANWASLNSHRVSENPVKPCN